VAARVKAAGTPAERAAAFVGAHGDELARRRAAVLVGRCPPGRVLEAVDPDGALADVAAMRRLLALCDDLRVPDAPLAGRVARGLASAQAADGSWAEGSAPGVDARLVTTGMLAGYLAKTPFARPETLAAAGDFLAAHFRPERLQGGRWPEIAAYAHYFANALHDSADEVLQWCGRELERGFRTRAFDAVRTARVFAWCDALALPGARIDAQELWLALISEQEPDGGFAPAAGAGTRERVAHSLDALAALARLWRR
jgi:hypothetical protein